MGFLLLSSNVNVEESWYYRLPVDADEEWVSQEEPRKLSGSFTSFNQRRTVAALSTGTRRRQTADRALAL